MSWWFCLLHLRTEEGKGCPNESRLGPYASQEDAAGALARMKARTDRIDRDDAD